MPPAEESMDVRRRISLVRFEETFFAVAIHKRDLSTESLRPLFTESPPQLLKRAGRSNAGSMDINLSLDLVLYGVMLIGFSALASRKVLDVGDATLITSLVGGVISVFWGVRGLLGFRVRAGATVTLAVMAVLLLALTVNAWLAVGAGVETLKLASMILTVLLVFAIGQLANFMQAGRRSPAISETNAAGVSSERDASHVFDK